MPVKIDCDGCDKELDRIDTCFVGGDKVFCLECAKIEIKKQIECLKQGKQIGFFDELDFEEFPADDELIKLVEEYNSLRECLKTKSLFPPNLKRLGIHKAIL
jgi:hypothetical protein